MRSALIIFLLFPLIAMGKQEGRISAYVAKYPDKGAVVLSQTRKSTIVIEKGVPVVYSHDHEELLLLTDRVMGYAEQKIYFSSFSSISEIKGTAKNPNSNGRYKRSRVRDKFVTNELSSGNFYDDFKAYNLVYTGLVKGSRLIQDYDEKLNDAHMFGRFYFNASVPVERSEFTVVVPVGVNIEWKLFNITESELEFRMVDKYGVKTYTWKKKDAKEYCEEKDGPDISWYAQHVVVYITSYMNSGKTISFLNGTQGLYNWYSTFIADTVTNDKKLQAIVDSLVTGITDEQQKVKQIYYWVQDNIEYVAFEDGMGGFIPRPPGIICSRRYGDCKDMANVLRAMLQMAGIQSYITWIGTRDIPYRYSDVPTPMADNHMICTYIADGTYYFLDATGKNAPFGMPTAMIQGKEALIGKGHGMFEVVTVPVVDAVNNVRVDSIFMSLGPDATLYGTGNMTTSGYERIDLVFSLSALNENEKLEFVAGYLEKGSNRFAVDSLAYNNLYNREENLEVSFAYTLDKYAHQNDSDVYVNMCLDRSWVNSIADTARRTSPYEVEYRSIDTYVTILNIPSGYSVSCMPENTNVSIGDYTCTITYRQKANRLICEKTIIINTLMITGDQFLLWNEFSAALTDASNKNVTLSRSTVQQRMTPEK